MYNDINISKKDWEDPRQNPNVDDVETGMASGDKTQSTSQRSLSSLATETELTPQRLFDHYQPEDKIEEYYADLGRQCADAAVGVDFVLLIALDGSNSSSEALEDNSVPDFGLPLFLPLAERSGTGAPLIVDLASLLHSTRNMEHDHSASPSSTRNPTITKSNSTEIQSPDTPLSKMYRDVLARTPWQPGIVFGAELRVRISPGFAVDPTMISRVPGVSGPQLAPLYYEAGLVGPASGVGNESTQLWRMGTTDPYTAFTMDLELTQPKVPEYCHVDGLGNVPIKPVIQTCFAYTTIIPDVDPQSGKISYQTVRRMRIASRPVPLAFTAEATYASLDTESLAVVLFHKIALASVQDGIVEAANMARQWVQLLMACVYRSAYANLKLERENAAAGIEPNKSDQTHRYFYPGERLLHLEGELSTDDVLLAQGHDRLRPVVLMVYLLLQSDPLRLSEGGQYYRPSFDYRSVLLSRMTSMTPCTLTRCIAPRLQLWESGANVHEPILEVIDLRSDAVQSAVLECSSNSSTSQDAGLILFLDTPEKIVVMDARYVNSDYSSANGNGTSNSPRQRKKSSPLVIGEGLKHAIEDAASSYRTRPDIVYQLDQSETSGEYTLLSLLDCLLEDTPHAASGCESFMEWKAMIARAVQT